jgi:hypothetical protein
MKKTKYWIKRKHWQHRQRHIAEYTPQRESKKRETVQNKKLHDNGKARETIV